jgi:hypothetical protein
MKFRRSQSTIEGDPDTIIFILSEIQTPEMDAELEILITGE